MEVPLRLSALLDVEAGESQDRRRDVDERQNPRPLPVGEKDLVQNEAGRDPERDHIDERIEFGAETGSRAGEARDASVQHVECAREDDAPPCPDQITASGRDYRVEPEEEVAERER